MKRTIIFILLASILAVVQFGHACVGRTVHLAITSAPNERLLAEMAALMITERTGSNVQIDVYKDSAELYSAVKQGKVNVMFENTTRAAEVLGKAKDSPYEQIKTEYRTKLNLTWLETIGGTLKYGPVLTTETLATYPALPKLLIKLSGALVNDTYAKLLKTVEAPDKTKKVARDFLKSKKLI
jgi:osmoprotectant transport system substrate-binding protein